VAAISAFEYAARAFEEPQQKYVSPGDLAKAIDPSTIQTSALDLIDQALMDVEAGLIDRLMIFMPPQEGKSTRVTKIGPLWALLRNPDRRIAVVSYGADLAQTFGREIRQMITSNQGQDGTLDLGLRIAPDNGAVSAWQIEGRRGGVRSIGLSGGITGRPADWLFIDDPLANREQAESERFRQRAKDFWTSTGSTRLAPGAPVVVILTRWHEDDLAGWLLGREDGDRWRVVNIPAQANHDPNKDQADPLGRQPGQYMQSARTNERTGQPRSDREWEQIKVQAGSRDWEALYQGNPAPPEGGTFKRAWWREYDVPLWLEMDNGANHVTHYDDLLISWDMTFKDTASSDYVVGQVWMRRGADAFLLDQVCDRMDFVTTCQRFRELAAKWPQATLKIVEDKANGTAVINSLRRIVPGIVPEEPHGSKEARAYAITPLVEAGNAWLPSPELAPWIGDFIEQAAAFPNAANDDMVDALSQALNRLILAPLLAGQDLTEPDEFAELDNDGYTYAPY
jgi:predicted phage terminase large subunit-like protein